MIFGDPAREVKPFEGKFGTGGTLAVGLRTETFGYFVQDLEGELLVEARRLHDSGTVWQYEFRVTHDARLLAQGRATVSVATRA